jgi:hypothetical protein
MAGTQAHLWMTGRMSCRTIMPLAMKKGIFSLHLSLILVKLSLVIYTKIHVVLL